MAVRESAFQTLLPGEVASRILHFLPISDLRVARLTCRTLRSLVARTIRIRLRTTIRLWHKKCKYAEGHHQLPHYPADANARARYAFDLHNLVKPSGTHLPRTWVKPYHQFMGAASPNRHVFFIGEQWACLIDAIFIRGSNIRRVCFETASGRVMYKTTHLGAETVAYELPMHLPFIRMPPSIPPRRSDLLDIVVYADSIDKLEYRKGHLRRNDARLLEDPNVLISMAYGGRVLRFSLGVWETLV